MFRKAALAVSFAVIAIGATTLAVTAQSERTDTPQTIVVKMVDVSATEYRFEPAEITASPGDTIRFEQAGQMPHNVEFKDVPEGSNLGAAVMGPFLTALGQTYDLVVDTRFVQGAYDIVCTPHQTMGMTGTITVQ